MAKGIKRKRYKYMHTLDGRPARWDGEQLVLVERHSPPAPLVGTLAQIHRERRASAAWRRCQGFGPGGVCSHIKVEP